MPGAPVLNKDGTVRGTVDPAALAAAVQAARVGDICTVAR